MKYSSEHHSWNYTIMASSNLTVLGRYIESDKSYSFSCFTGSMLLAVLGLESFLNSMGAFIDYENFCYSSFERKSILDKLDFFISYYNLSFDKGCRPYQTIVEAITWRNSVSHSKPIFVDEVEINQTSDIRKLQKKHLSSTKYKPFENLVNEKTADRYNRDIIDVIQEIIKTSGINPVPRCVYKI